jgi:hypothetical protein
LFSVEKADTKNFADSLKFLRLFLLEREPVLAIESRKGIEKISNSSLVNIGSFIRQYPSKRVREILKKTKKASRRERALPAHIVFYYVIALALFANESYREILRWMMEGLQWTGRRRTALKKLPVKSAITQARQRLGIEPLKAIYEEFVKPIATLKTKGAWYRQWRVVSLDGSTIDVTDTPENAKEFGRVKGIKRDSAYPKMRFSVLVENGTRVLFGLAFGNYEGTSELVLAKQTIQHLTAGMLCLADRYYLGHEFWTAASKTGADLLWRLRKTIILPAEIILPDGSYLSTLYPSVKDRNHRTNGTVVRVVEYRLKGVPGAEPYYRLITTILDPAKAPAQELAALYHERWEIETALLEIKSRLPGGNILLRSKTPDLAKQELYGFMLAYFAIRGLMHEAALEADVGPTQLSFLHTVRVLRRKLQQFIFFPTAAVA